MCMASDIAFHYNFPELSLLIMQRIVAFNANSLVDYLDNQFLHATNFETAGELNFFKYLADNHTFVNLNFSNAPIRALLENNIS
jgi:hypothetical protein